MSHFTFNNLEHHLRSDDERRFYVRDLAMLTVTGALSDALEKAGLSRAELAQKLGRTKGFVSQILSGSRNMTLATVSDVLWALNLELSGLHLRPIGERKVPHEMMNEWLDCEKDVIQAEIIASPQESFDDRVEATTSIAV